MSRRAIIILVSAIVVVLVGGGLAIAWAAGLFDDPPPKAALGDCASSGGGGSADGSWKVRTGTGFVGYRMKELFGGATIKRTAAGRTSDVTGTMTIDGTKVNAAEITADLSTLSSDKVARDTAIHDQGLETDKFPKSTFTLATAATLPSVPAQGKAVKATVHGELDLHGQKKPVTVPVEACWTGKVVKVSGSAPVVLADYGIDAISTPIVKIDDLGSFEFELTFVPA